MEKKLRFALALKMLVGFIIAFSVAYLFELPYSYTAGVIAILHLWYSRDNVFKAALTRLLASVIGLAVSALLFYLFGYNLINLFMMVLAVLAVLYLLKLEYGATIALVLIGQQWAEQTTWAPLNALLIMIIGTIPALLLNFFTFRKSKVLYQQQILLDQAIAKLFINIEAITEDDLVNVNNVLENTKQSLQVALENYKIENIMQAFSYINVRAEQIKILEDIVKTLNSLYDSPYKQKIIDYLHLFKDRIGFTDFASDLLVKHDQLLMSYRELPLPQTREEFEHRAALYGVLLEIKQFLLLKKAYHDAFPVI